MKKIFLAMTGFLLVLTNSVHVQADTSTNFNFPSVNKVESTIPFGDWHASVVADNQLVLVGGSLGARILTTRNGKDWTKAEIEPSTYGLNSVAYGNGIFVAVGNVSTIVTSRDGSHWTDANPLGRGVGAKIHDLTSVVYANGMFIATARVHFYCEDGNPIFTSTDGITWIERFSSGKGSEKCAMPIRSIIYAKHTFVGVGNEVLQGNGLAITSNDGINWTQQPAKIVNGSTNDDYSLHSVTFANSIYVAVGNYKTPGDKIKNAIYVSNDGINWAFKNPITRTRDKKSITELALVEHLHANRVLSLPEGENANVIALMPSLIATHEHYQQFFKILCKSIV